MTVRSVIAGVGSALPKRRVDNAELAAQVDTTDAWIVERTGIRSRTKPGFTSSIMMPSPCEARSCSNIAVAVRWASVLSFIRAAPL